MSSEHNAKLDVPRRSLLARVNGVLGIDRPIALTICARGWNTAAGAINILLIARFLSLAEQGYYYTFSSLVALQIIFELGFSFVILQLASHERAHLAIGADYSISGDPVAHARLASILKKTVKWYTVAAIAMGTTLIPAGWWFFSHHSNLSGPVHWKLPWCLAALAATLNFQLDPVLSFLEGCGYVADVAHVRFVQAILGSLFAWTALVSHHGLFAPSMVMLGTALVSLFWLLGKRRFLVELFSYPTHEHNIRWTTEVWPFQWRIAVSWLCGYFIFQLFNPVLFAFQGPAVAGQMGMSLSVASALQGIAFSWINTKSAPFGTLIAQRRFGDLDRLFFRSVKQSLAVHLAGTLTLWTGVSYLNHVGSTFARRLLSPTSLAFILAATLINTVVFSEALYLRAHKEEKFLQNSIVTAIFAASSTYFFGRYIGASGVAAGYLAVVFFVSLGMGTYTFAKYRRLWHVQS